MEMIQSKIKSYKRKRIEEMITEAETEAAQHLMHLSDEEISIINKKKKIEEIFGNDHHVHQDQCTKKMVNMRVIMSSKKKKKYRTIESLYMETRPIRVVLR